MSRKKVLSILTILLILVCMIPIIFPQKTALFFIPHQDDETITFSPAIENYIKKGYDVHVVLATDGISSSIRENILNGKDVCNIHKERHEFNISSTKFTRLRDKEYENALIALGVKSENIHISRFASKDGELNVDRAKTIINDYIEQYPKAKVFTFSDLSKSLTSGHNDHYTLGIAAKELYNEGKINDLEMFVEFYVYPEFISKYKNIDIKKYKPENKSKIENAVKSYTNYDPKNEHYAIGNHSVRQFFEKIHNDLDNDRFVSYYYNVNG